MLGLSLYTTFLFLTCIYGTLGSGILSFTDAQCKKSHEALDVKNGYPEGLCTPLEITRTLEAFQIVKLDPGCQVTLYGANDASGQDCSSPLKILGELATCYNSSWIYYSVDNCLVPDQTTSSVPALLPVATESSSTASTSMPASSTSSTSSTSSSLASTSAPPSSNKPGTTNAPLIIGAIIGSVVICAVLIGLLVFCLHRRKSQKPKKPPYPPSYELSQERALNEMSRSSVVPPHRAVRKEMWASEAAIEIGRNSYAPPVELPAVNFDQDKKRGSAMIRVHLGR